MNPLLFAAGASQLAISLPSIVTGSFDPVIFLQALASKRIASK
jgi:hypothetical protein